ncbi:MAG: hypothetical protein ACSHX8_01450 [Opitutaceae bacterium]
MKNKTHLKVLILTTLALFGATYANAGAGHDHSEHGHKHDKKAGPNGGRLITSVNPHLEFLVTPERFVQITFLDHDGEVVPVDGQVVSAIGGSRSAPTKIEFVASEGKLVSKNALPEMKNMPIVLQVKATSDAETVREKFYLNMTACPSCSYKEYACICGH